MRDFESLGTIRPPVFVHLLEVYSGQAVVAWQGRIERQLLKSIGEYEAAKNSAYVDKLREYLKVWRDNTLSGSINVEVVHALLTATEMLSVDGWKLQNYFSNLRDELRRLQASVEELPAQPPEEEYDAMRQAAGAAAPSQPFGSEETPTSGTEPQPGSEPPAGGAAPEGAQEPLEGTVPNPEGGAASAPTGPQERSAGGLG